MGKTLITLIMLMVPLMVGCTDRISYRHDWIDETGTLQKISVWYSEGLGNSQKNKIVVTLPDKAKLQVGDSVTNQDEFMKVMAQWGITLEKIAEAAERWMVP